MLITWGGRGHGEEEVFIWDPEIRLFSFEKKEIIKRTKKIYENGERMSKKTSNMDGKKIVGEPDASCLNQSPATWWVSRSKLRTWAER